MWALSLPRGRPPRAPRFWAATARANSVGGARQEADPHPVSAIHKAPCSPPPAPLFLGPLPPHPASQPGALRTALALCHGEPPIGREESRGLAWHPEILEYPDRKCRALSPARAAPGLRSSTEAESPSRAPPTSAGHECGRVHPCCPAWETSPAGSLEHPWEPPPPAPHQPSGGFNPEYI